MRADARRRTGPGVVTALAVLAAAGCSRPDWTNPETSKGARALPPPAAAKAIPTEAGGAPELPAWLSPLIGRAFRTAYPRDGVCVGNTDGITRLYTGSPRGAQIVGWAWDHANKAPAARVVLVDPAGRIVGGGETGTERADVPRAIPTVTSSKVGWEAVSTVTVGRIDAFAVIEDGKAVCPLAGADF